MSCEVVEQFSDSTFSARSCHVRVQSEPASRRTPCPNGWCVNRKLFFHCILVPSTNYPHISTSNRQVPFLITSTYTKIVTTYIPLNLPRYFKLKKTQFIIIQVCQIWYPKMGINSGISKGDTQSGIWLTTSWKWGRIWTLDHTSIGWLLNFDSIIKLVISNLPVDALCSDN